MAEWQAPSFLGEKFGLSEITAAILAGRGFSTESSAQAFLNPDFYRPALPESLRDLACASQRLQKAVYQKERVLLWGDIDTDGLTATALLAEALSTLGADLKIHIPQRHGIQLEPLRELCTDFRPAVLIACDTGSQAHVAARFALESNIDFIILDHHQLPDKLPPAYALVNPQRQPVPRGLENLSAVGVVFLLVQHLYAHFQKTKELPHFGDLVALGLVADAVPLMADNRYWVQKGLQTLKNSQRLGLLALAQVSNVDLAHLTERDIMFDFAPRLNAFGRLSRAHDGLNLLMTQDAGEARILAAQADAYNQKRRLMTRQLKQAIHEQIQHDPTLLQWQALVLENTRWEGGVLSAVANQIAETFERPVVLLASSNEIASGSARSFGAYNILAALDSTSDLLISYGGHEHAAGVSLLLENIPIFRRRLHNALTAQKIDSVPYEREVEGILPLERATLDLARDLEKLAPFGVGNPAPIFLARAVHLVRSAKIGRDDQHRRLTVREPASGNYSVLWWNSSELPMPEGTFDLAYQIAPVREDDRYELQITFVDWEQIAPPEVKPLSQLIWVDCRENFNLAAIKTQATDLVIWAEGYSRRESVGLPLSELTPSENLLIYTAPASAKNLQTAAQRVQPQKIYVYGELPVLSEPEEILSAMVGLLRVTYEKMDGVTDITQLAERLAQSNEVILAGIENLALQAEWQTRNRFKILALPTADKIKIMPKFKRLVEESAAYRRYFRRAELEKLLE